MTSAPVHIATDRPTADRPGRSRRRWGRRVLARAVVVAAVAGTAVTGLGHVVLNRHYGLPFADGRPGGALAPADTPPAAADPAEAPAGFTRIPGLGARTRSAIPAATRQVLVAAGKSKDSAQSVVTLWSRTADGRWHPGAAWPAHNALRGWTRRHYAGDLHSPIGVFTLHDAGGFDADPGSRLPYHHSAAFHAGGVGFNGEPLDAAFDYVVAIDYNRVPGTSPLDGAQPLGPRRGGGIWVHVDHGGPTHGCVSIAPAHMIALLRTLVPADHPVIVMGDRASLAA